MQVDLEARFAKFSVSAPQNSFPGWHPDIAAKSFQILKVRDGRCYIDSVCFLRMLMEFCLVTPPVFTRCMQDWNVVSFKKLTQGW